MNNNFPKINFIMFAGVILMILIITGILLIYSGIEGLLTRQLKIVFFHRYRQNSVKGIEGIILSIRNIVLGIVFMLAAYISFRIIFTF